jgi:hypothetical protein
MLSSKPSAIQPHSQMLYQLGFPRSFLQILGVWFIQGMGYLRLYDIFLTSMFYQFTQLFGIEAVLEVNSHLAIALMTLSWIAHVRVTALGTL